METTISDLGFRVWMFPRIRGSILWVLQNKDCSILGSVLVKYDALQCGMRRYEYWASMGIIFLTLNLLKLHWSRRGFCFKTR